MCLSSHPEGDRPENSVQNRDLLLAGSVLQVVVVGVGEQPIDDHDEQEQLLHWTRIYYG